MKFRLSVLFIIIIGLVFYPGCKTTEECTFDITGAWTLNLIITDYGTETLTMTFTGSTSSGTVYGFGTHVATYTVTDCNTVQLILDFWGSGCHLLYTWDGTSTSDTVMNGTFVATNSCETTTLSGTWSATKIL